MHLESLLFVLGKSNCFYHLLFFSGRPGRVRASCSNTLKFVTETKITNSNENTGLSNIPGYVFEHFPTPLACGGVGLFVDETLSYSVLEKLSTESFQASWIEISFVNLWSLIPST